MPYIVHTSPYSVSTTIEKLQASLHAKQTTIFILVDHSGEARQAKLDLPDEQLLIFGDPKIGTYLMQENPAIGFDLPLKILVWQDSKGITQIAYTNPLILKERYHIEKNAGILEKMAQGLSQLINTITQKEKNLEVNK